MTKEIQIIVKQNSLWRLFVPNKNETFTVRAVDLLRTAEGVPIAVIFVVVSPEPVVGFEFTLTLDETAHAVGVGKMFPAVLN